METASNLALGIGQLPMKIVFMVVAVVIVAALAYADYKWRRWIADRRRERQ